MLRRCLVYGGEADDAGKGSVGRRAGMMRLECQVPIVDWNELLVVLHGPLRLKLADGQICSFTRIWTPEANGSSARVLH